MTTATRQFGAAILLLALSVSAQQAGISTPHARSTNLVDTAQSAVKAGNFTYRLTTPEEVTALLGEPEKQQTRKDGDSTIYMYEYPGVEAVFVNIGSEPGSPRTLLQMSIEGKKAGIGEGRIVTLRSTDDLSKLDTFWGAANVSLVKLNLVTERSRLDALPFDTRTQWPPADKLPPGFDPAKILEYGKNPGLGVRGLHQQGLTGKGIHIAIIDQPLLREHREYKDRVADYQEMDVQGVPPQMHGPAVTSIAVGKSCGTAPDALVHYYAVPTWKWWNEYCRPYAATLERIIEANKRLPVGEKVRVVSLSLGAFSEWPDRAVWSNAVKHAGAEGILVVTCDGHISLAPMLKRLVDKDADAPENYTAEWPSPEPVLCVPAGNRATAGYTGPEDYVFWRMGGASWTVPYLAGLAALAFQVDPSLKPEEIPGLWEKTATRTSAGPVVNPRAFIEAVRQSKAVR